MTTWWPAAEPAQPYPVFDGHVDLLYFLQSQPQPFTALSSGPVTPADLGRGRVRALASALYCADRHNGPTAATHLAKLHGALCRQLAALPVIRDRADLVRAWEGHGPSAQLLLLENADALAELGAAPLLAWGIFTVGLTHAGSNRLADGNAVADPQGLRPAGRRLLTELAAHRRCVDLAHLAEPALGEVLDQYDGPLCCSHTGLRRFCDQPRNLSDTRIGQLLARGGMLGLSLAPEMLCDHGRADLDEVFQQLDWLVQRHGPVGIGLGSDLGGFTGSCHGLEGHGRLDRLVARLEGAGYPEETIARLLGENWYRFYWELLPAVAPPEQISCSAAAKNRARSSSSL